MRKILITFLLLAVLTLIPAGVFAQSPFGEAPQNPENPGTATDPGAVTTPGVATGAGQGALVSPNQDAGVPGSTPTNQNAGGANNAGGSGLLPMAQNAGGAQKAGGSQNVGNSLNAGNGSSQNFWQYLLSLLNGNTLNGQNFQSTDKNEVVPSSSGQPDSVLQFQNQWSAPTPVQTISQKGNPNFFNCSFNQSNKTLGGYLGLATCVMVYLIPIVLALLVLWFMFGSIQYINDSEHEERGQYKVFLTWGVIILFVAVSFVGILRLMSKTLGI